MFKEAIMKPQIQSDELREISPSNILTALILILGSCFFSILGMYFLIQLLGLKFFYGIAAGCVVWSIYLVYLDAKGEEL